MKLTYERARSEGETHVGYLTYEDDVWACGQCIGWKGYVGAPKVGYSVTLSILDEDMPQVVAHCQKRHGKALIAALKKNLSPDMVMSLVAHLLKGDHQRTTLALLQAIIDTTPVVKELKEEAKQ